MSTISEIRGVGIDVLLFYDPLPAELTWMTGYRE